MRLIGLALLAIAAMAGLWYTSGHRLPYYYDAMIFILAITGAELEPSNLNFRFAM